jgi:hypothetical protein
MNTFIKSSVMLAVVLLCATPASAIDNTGKLAFGINGGLSIPAGGDVTANSALGDVYDLGPTFGAHVKYGVIKEVTVETGFKYAFMKTKDEYLPDDGLESYFSVPQVYFDGVFNLGSFINKSDNIFNPYLKAGGELAFWKFTDDGAGGDAVILENGEEFSATSFGLNFGGGLEVFATPSLSIFAEGLYHMDFTEDEEKFGTDFGNAGLIDVNVGLSFYFPLQGQ